MDIYDLEFSPAMKAGDFARAKNALEKWKGQTTETMYLWAKSTLMIKIGEVSKANEILSKVIDKGMDEDKICQYTRAENYLNNMEYTRSLADYNSILADKSPKVQEMLASECLFRKAFILSVLGDSEFSNTIDSIAEGDDNFITDAIYDKASLIKIYNATKKPLREKPKLE
jgi:tetratricopeptide (TPR) repeat protein